MSRTSALALVVLLIFSSFPAAAADEAPVAVRIITNLTPSEAVRDSRPVVIPALYASLAALHAMDLYTTRAAIDRGAREANPVMAPFTGSRGAGIAFKAAATAGTIYVAERLWRKNRVGAVVLLAAVNAATVTVIQNNVRNAHRGARR